MSTSARVFAIAIGLAPLVSRPAVAQDQRLDRLAPAARTLVASVIDSARTAGLPAEPLVDRALEGASKNAPAPLIAAAVRRLAADLGRARDALGVSASPAELTAAADALRAGATPTVLLRVRQALGPRSLTVPFGGTADLTARGVAADTAATLVISAARSLADAELLAVQRDVERAIALGAYPLEAVTRGFGFSLDAANPTTTGETGTTQTIAPKTPRKP